LAGYNAGGFFTPGAVIANNKDSGVFFYNPALLAYSTKNSTSITGTIYQWQSTTIKNGIGTGKNLSSKGASIIPQMVSGTLTFKSKKPIVIAYALIRTPVIDFSATQRRDDRFNVLDDSYSPGPEYYVGQYSYRNETTLTSGVLSTGFKVRPGLAAGISAEVQIRKQSLSSNFTSRAIINTGNDPFASPIASAEDQYEISHTHLGLKLKGGLSYDAGRHHLGLLVTAPLLRLGGSGTLLADVEINNITVAPGTQLHLMANTRQENLKSNWKMPLSLGFGYAYDYRGGQLYLATEYFTSVKEYSVIKPRNEYFLRPDTGNNNEETAATLAFKDARKSVLNVAVGISHALRPSLMGYLSVRTDFSYADKSLFADDNGHGANTTNWGNMHVQFGVNVKKRKFNFRPGLLLTYGHTKKFSQPANFDNPNESNFLQGDMGLTSASHLSVGLLFSYIHNL
jgi:hypothetical protein